MPSLLNQLTTGVSYDLNEDIQPREGNSSFGQKLQRAMMDESAFAMSVASIGNAFNDEPVDAEFKKNISLQNELYKPYEAYIKPEFKNYIMENSKNVYDYKNKLDFYKQQSGLEKEIEDMGVSGMFLRMGGALPDVIPLIGATMTAPVSATAIGSSVALRTLLGFTLSTTAEGIRRELGDRERTTLESALSIGLGTAVASAFGKASVQTLEVAKNSIKRELKYDSELEQQIIKAEAGELKNADGTLITKDDIIKARAKEVGLSQNQYKTFNAVLKEVEKEAKRKNFDEGFASALRVDLAHLTKKSDSDSMSSFGQELFPDSTLQTNQAGKQYLAEVSMEIEKRIQQSVANNFAGLVNKFGSLAYGKGILATRFSGVGEELSQLAGSAQIKRTLGIYSRDDAINEVFNHFVSKGISDADATSMAEELIKGTESVAKDAHKTLSQYGKKGFADGTIKENDSYMPIVYSFNTDEILKQKGFTQDDFANFLHQSMVQGLVKRGKTPGEIPENVLKDLARNIAYKMRKNEYRDDMHNKSIQDILNDELVKTDNIPNNMKEALSVFARERTFFDYSHTMTKVNPDGTVSKLGFDDIVNKDLFNIYNQYAKKMGGDTALDRYRFTVNKQVYDFTKANEIKSAVINEIKNLYRNPVVKDLFKDSKNFDDVLSKIDVKFGKFINSADTLLKDNGIDINNLTEENIKFITENFNNLDTIGYQLLTSKTNIEKVLNSVDDSMKQQVKDLAYSVESMFRRFADEAHKTIKDEAEKIAKESGDKNFKFTDEVYKQMFDDLYKKIKNSNIGSIDALNQLQKDIFTKTETKEYSLATDEGIQLYKQRISDELKAKGVTGRTYQKELDRFDEIIKEMRGMPTAVNPNSLGTQAQRVMRNMNIARLLGQTAFTMSAELGAVMVQAGIKDFIEYAPSALKGIISQVKTGKIDSELAQEIQTFMGLGGDLYKAIGIGKYEHDFNILQMNNARAIDGFMNKAELLSEKFAEATLLFGGVKPLTNLFQMVTAMSSVNNILKIAGKETLSSNDAKFLNEIGIGTDMLGRISSQIKTHGSTQKTKWSNGHKVSELGFEKWDDTEARQMLITGIRRLTDTVVQQSHIGDKIGTMDLMGSRHLFRNTVLGKFALELKDYMITSYVKQFGRAYSRRDLFTFATIMTQASFLTLSKILQNQVNYAGNDEKREKAMKPERIAQSVISNIGVTSYLPPMMDTTTDILFGEKYFSESRYNSGIQGAFMALPSVDAVVKTGQLMSAIPDSIRAGEVQNKSINALFGLAPMGNSIFAKPIHQSLLEKK